MRIKKDLVNPPIMGSRSQILEQLLNELGALAKGDTQKALDEKDGEEEADDFLLSSPPRGRRPSQEEDDKTYIKRVMTEMRKSGRHPDKKTRISPKGSIMKRSTISPKHKDHLQKTVSFQPSSAEQPDGDDTTSDTSSVQLSPSRTLTSSRRKIAKLSKRTKMRMFQKQVNMETFDDDKESIILNEEVESRSSSSSAQEECDLTDHGNQLENEITAKKGKEEVDEQEKIGESICEEEVFNELISSPKSDDRFRLSVSSSFDASQQEAFRFRAKTTGHNSLSRSPAVKRRNEHMSLKIAGLATLGSQRMAGFLDPKRIASSTKSIPDNGRTGERPSSQHLEVENPNNNSLLLDVSIPSESSTPTTTAQIHNSEEARSAAATTLQLNLSGDDCKSLDEAGCAHAMSPTSSSSSSSPRSSRRLLSPTLLPVVTYFEEGAYKNGKTAFGDDEDAQQTESNAPVRSPPSSPRRPLPRPPAFDGESIAKIHKKLSLEMKPSQ
jgi:hypothetical protein